MNTDDGITNCKYRVLVLFVLSIIMFHTSFVFSSDYSPEVISYVQAFAIFPIAIGLVDALTVRSRNDKRNLLFVLVSMITSVTSRGWITINNMFGESKSVTVDDVLIDECDNKGCTHTEHRGIEITYRDDYLVFGVSQDNTVHTRQYCNSCVNKPTFEIKERWGRDPIVVERLNEYYTTKY